MAPKQKKSSPSKIHDQKLRLFIEKHPDAYLREIATEFGTTLQAVFYACKRLKNFSKKNQKRDERKRQEFLNELAKIPETHRIYLDESGINKYLSREHARALRGTQVYGSISDMRYARESFIATQKEKQILAPFCYQGTCDIILFNVWVKKFLLPELKPSQVIIVDNATYHKSGETKKLIEGAGCRV